MITPEISQPSIPAQAPANRISGSSSNKTGTNSPAKFATMLGAMTSDNRSSDSRATSAKSDSGQDPNVFPPLPPQSQPNILPIAFGFHILPANLKVAKNSSKPDEEGTASQPQPAAGTPAQPPTVNLSVAVSTQLPVIAPTGSPDNAPQVNTIDAIFAKNANLAANLTETQNQDRAKTIAPAIEEQAGPLNKTPDQPLSTKTSVAQDDAGALVKPVLAFGAKLTPIPQFHEQPVASGSKSIQPAANTLSALDSRATQPSAASSGGEQTGSNDNGSPSAAFREFTKTVAKPPTDDHSMEQDGQTAAIGLDRQPAPDSATSQTQIGPIAAPSPHPATESLAKAPEPTPAGASIDARPAAAALPASNSTLKSEPVRDLTLKIGTGPSNQVEVKIQERAGEVKVAVLSSSPSLTTDLRQQVGDLVGRLDRAGYHAETFRPSASGASQNSSNQPDSNETPGQNGGRQQQQQDENNQQNAARQKRAGQAQWLQAMNGNFNANAAGETGNK